MGHGGERVKISSPHAKAIKRRSAVNWKNGRLLAINCFRVSRRVSSRTHCNCLRPAQAQLRSTPYLFTTSLNALPAVNLTVFDAGS